jgi:hypothetical protein
MTEAGSRTRQIGLALIAALVVALGLYWRTGADTSPTARPPLAAPMPGAPTLERERVRPQARLSSVASPRNGQERVAARPSPAPSAASPQARPTPPVFDLATLPRSGEPAERTEEERFRTNQWFTDEDLQHPELYFKRAEQMPELNRPEERRDALDFFLAYREKLGRDLEAAGENRDERQRILATLARYDAAIARLRELVAGEAAK